MAEIGTRPVARIGTSGWDYPEWRGVFYPPGLARRRWLAHLAERLDSVELNASFYRLLRPDAYRGWRAATPPGFVLAVKGSRLITHVRRLADVRELLANFFSSGVLALGDRLGPVLWQLPPSTVFDPGRLDPFLRALPRTTGEAARLAAEHDARLPEGRVFVPAGDGDRPVRHALEARHPSFAAPACAELLRARDVALVVSDSPGWPQFREVTAGFVYVRLHGAEELYVSGYPARALDAWAGAVAGWLSGRDCPDGRGRDVYVYFDNTARGRAPLDAVALRDRLGLK